MMTFSLENFISITIKNHNHVPHDHASFLMLYEKYFRNKWKHFSHKYKNYANNNIIVNKLQQQHMSHFNDTHISQNNDNGALRNYLTSVVI